MLRNKEFKKYIKFEKTIEDLYDDSDSGIFAEMGETGFSPVPDFVANEMFDLESLDEIFLSKYSERWLNKTSGNEYSVDANDDLENPQNLNGLAEKVCAYYKIKWDNLLYLYLLKMGKIGEEGVDYNPIENYSSYETTTYNSVKDSLVKSGVERHSQKAQVKQAPMKTVTKVTDEYGTADGQGTYSNGIKDKTEYSRKYKTTDTAGKIENGTEKPFVSTDEKGIAGMDSSGNFGSADAGDIPASGGVTGYNQSDMNIHTELGEHSSQFEDVATNNKMPYESTERTGKHSSTSEFGGAVDNGAVVQGVTQIVTELDPTLNYTELSYRPDASGAARKDENTKTGNFTVEKSGNIGVMTVADMIQKFLESDYIKNTFLDYVLQDVADFISLKCY